MPTLYIIDGYAQFFRAYHAIRTPMTSPVTKEPTNMTYGFLGMLLKLLRGRTRGSRPPASLTTSWWRSMSPVIAARSDRRFTRRTRPTARRRRKILNSRLNAA